MFPGVVPLVQLGVSPIGVSPNGVSPNGVSPIGVSPNGVSPIGVSPLIVMDGLREPFMDIVHRTMNLSFAQNKHSRAQRRK